MPSSGRGCPCRSSLPMPFGAVSDCGVQGESGWGRAGAPVPGPGGRPHLLLLAGKVGKLSWGRNSCYCCSLTADHSGHWLFCSIYVKKGRGKGKNTKISYGVRACFFESTFNFFSLIELHLRILFSHVMTFFSERSKTGTLIIFSFLVAFCCIKGILI